MHAILHGTTDRPAATAVGSWDPYMPHHDRLVEHLAERAVAEELAVVPVMITPPPGTLIHADMPTYDAAVVRRARLRLAGAQAIVEVAFEKEDLGRGLEDLIAVVDEYVRIGHLVAGSKQQFGSGYRGNGHALLRAKLRRAINVSRMAGEGTKGHRVEAVRALMTGRLADAVQVIGRAPVRARAEEARLRWPPGPYRARPLDAALRQTGRAVLVELRRDGDCATFDWPVSDAPFLEFVTGPRDERSRPLPTVPCAA